MSWSGILSGLAAWVTPVNKGLDIVDQWVTDTDKAAELKAQIYIEELRTSTIPLIDAAHKMGRQTMAYFQMAFYFYCVNKGIEITPELVAGVSGCAGIYAAVKGKGK